MMQRTPYDLFNITYKLGKKTSKALFVPTVLKSFTIQKMVGTNSNYALTTAM